MEIYQYYYILYLVDYLNEKIYISNTDPITYSPNISYAKLYETEANVDNDILDIHDRISEIINKTDITHFYKAKIKMHSFGKTVDSIMWEEQII